MQHRIRDVLLVSSLYDAYILQEDGHLTEKVYVEYRELKLSSAPRFHYADSAEAAVEAMGRRRFDLVLVVGQLQGPSVPELARKVKAIQPSVAVVLLTFDSRDYEPLRHVREDPAVDGIFAWSGDAKILLALSKFVEDSRNVDHDIAVADVRVILLVEDSIRFYSSFLSSLYPELMMQSQSLFSEGTNRLQKLLMMRTRPKVLLAQDYEQACLLIDRYQDNILALICDLEFPCGGQLDRQAGFRLVERVRRALPDLPILLQSAEADPRDVEARSDIRFVNKNAPNILHQIWRFLREDLGFGPFIFRMPDGRELRRARDIQELATCIERVPAASLAYHSNRNHFSTWLMARSEFDLAALMRPVQVSDFSSVEEFRIATVAGIRKQARTLRRGVISDFSIVGFQDDCTLQRVGSGSLGGKARGIAFVDHLLALRPELVELGNLQVRVPQTFVVATGAFDEFLQENDLYALATGAQDDERITSLFLAAPLPASLMDALQSISQNVRYPLAVRSSCLLEDYLLHAVSGFHETVLLANQDPDPRARLGELAQAVKLVYAYTFFGRSRRHLTAMGRSIEEEKMAVVVQQVIGRPRGDRYLPFCTGVGRSHNFYALPPQRPSEGVVQLVLGMGFAPFDHDSAVLFSPLHPHVHPQYGSLAERARLAPRSFLALDLRSRFAVDGAHRVPILRRLPLEEAHRDTFLRLAVSRYVPGARALVSEDDGPGEPIVTFEGLLGQTNLPVAESMRSLLSLAAAGLGMPVELDFALDLDGNPQDGFRGTLYPIELRPQVYRSALEEREATPREREVVCRTPFALGHSPHMALHDLVFVRSIPEAAASHPELAREIAALDRRLRAEQRPYVLVGPGRWGEADRGGVPITWDQVSGARVFVELWPKESAGPAPGVGFFDQVAQGYRGYLVLPPGAATERADVSAFVDLPFLETQPALSESALVRHLRLSHPLVARINDPTAGGELIVAPDASGQVR